MLLVMSTAGIFEQHQDPDSEQKQDASSSSKGRKYSALWQVEKL